MSKHYLHIPKSCFEGILEVVQVGIWQSHFVYADVRLETRETNPREVEVHTHNQSKRYPGILSIEYCLTMTLPHSPLRDTFGPEFDDVTLELDALLY